ncbi:MAG: monofunctional biosynthetic peptidoglycan transglycosylase [Paludibacteraceae bacterium]|nr:monofunctional biosynthetic peptidoglycan transglycosylase [Paludibacteraceae bacterium]MBQ8721520.1 monofunctional biosynthetic peptidoglycan transglycosylase [Paludibacteraceae bacterium]
MTGKNKKKKKTQKSLGRRIWQYTYRTILILWLLSIVHVVALKYIPVYFTPLMVLRSCQSIFDGKAPRNDKTWMPIEQISHNLVVACIASEDNLFLKHNGFSERAIRQALIERLEGKRIRGGSTISQQTAKNVFTFCSRTWFRKGIETYYTILIELIWGKERIMEVYLNVVELGDGIYGVEAASRHYWGIPANKLSKSQSALMAAALPNPLHYSITRPGPYMQKRQKQILDLMPKMGKIEF